MADQLIDNSGLITGACADTDCPPGTTWGCCPDEPEFPTSPPRVEYCTTIDVGITDYYNFAEMIGFDNGNILLAYYGGGNSTFHGFRMCDEDLNTIYQVSADTLQPVAPDSTIVPNILKISEDQIIVAVEQDTFSVTSEYLICVINTIDGSVAHSFIPPETWSSFNDLRLMQYNSSENTIIISFYGVLPGGAGIRYGMKINLATGVQIVRWGKSEYQFYDSTAIAFEAAGNYYTGYYNERSVYGGIVNKKGTVRSFDSSGAYTGVLATGEVDHRFGTNFHETSKYIVISSGYVLSGGRKDFNNSEGQYSFLYIYDKDTMAFIKKVADPAYSGTGIDNYGFGYSIYEYGNFIVIGCPGRHSAYLYDSDFNFLYPINKSAPVLPSSNGGHAVMMTGNRLWFGQGNEDTYSSWAFKYCDYTNFGA